MSSSNLSGRPVFIVDGSRSPFLKAAGKPGAFQAADLAVQTARPLILKHQLAEDALDEVIIGCVSPSPNEANIARVIALRLGCSDSTPAMTVQRNCASGLQALDSAALNISSGRADLVLAGGTEAMSHSPVLLSAAMVNWLALWYSAKSISDRGRALTKLKPYYLKPVIALLKGLTDPFTGLSMGQTAENLAQRFSIKRQDMDLYALQSHQKLAAAIEHQHLDEITPLYSNSGDVYTTDTGLRADSSVEKLAKLRPVFDRPTGAVTAGNSAQVSDGAACLLLASEAAIKQHDLPVLGRIVDSQWAGLDPAQMGLGPVYAMAPILQRHKLDTQDIDYWEINEAFAAQVLACKTAWQDKAFNQQALGREQPFTAIADDKLNIDGGGVSLGHPVGASGARIVLHLLKTLQRTNTKRGMASLCIGGGQGGAMLVERV